MISVVIPTRDDERALFATLAALVPAAADGLVREVIVVDGGSTDGTARIADLTGCHWIDGPAGRSQRLALGVAAARGPWLFLLRPGAVPQDDWIAEIRAALADADGRRAFHFRRARASAGQGRLAAALTPAGLGALDDGLVIHRDRYRTIGGVRPLPALEIADLARRALGRSLLVLRLPTRMVARLYA